jgi:SAM-dependent methyltransferase
MKRKSGDAQERATYNKRRFHHLTVADLAGLFGTTAEEIEKSCGGLICKLDLRYEKLPIRDRDRLILEILKKIDSPDLPVAGQSRMEDWERGWAENLRDFIESGYDLNKLVPKYFKKNVPVRLNRDFVIPADPDFVLNCTNVFRTWLFRKYLKEACSVYEFGCGPGTHLAFLAAIYPDKRFYGLDWVKASQEIIRRVAGQYGWRIEGLQFNFFFPDESLHLEKGSAVFTFGALEQVGGKHEAFLQFLLKESPDICINVECLSEFYDLSYLTDFLSYKYHKRRNYLTGYLTRLQELESKGHIEILKAHHQKFGNIYNDSHSYVIWKPRHRG